MFPPLISSPPSPLFCVISPQYPSSSSSHPSIHICFYSFPPYSSFTPLFCLPRFPLEIVICKALCCPISLSRCCGLPLSPALSTPHEVLAQADIFSSWKTTTTTTMQTTLKQQNLPSIEICLSHAEPIFFTRLNKRPMTKWKWVGGVWLWFQSPKKAKRGCPEVLNAKNKLGKLLLYLSA